MKTILTFLGLLSFTLTAQASAPSPVVGEFEYAGRFTVLKNERVELVQGDSNSARRHIDDLKRDGHVCSADPRGTLCVKQYDLAKGMDWLRDAAESYYAGWLLRMQAPYGDMTLVKDTEEQKVWTVAQKAMLIGHATYYVDYIWTKGVWTLSLRQERGASEVSFLRSDAGLAMPLTLDRDDDPPGKQIVTIDAELRRVQ